MALVYACTEAVRSGWSSTTVIGLVAASVVLLGFFAFREVRTANPLLPPRIVADRNRGGAYIVVALVIAGMFGAFLFLTYYLQVVLRYTPLQEVAVAGQLSIESDGARRRHGATSNSGNR